MKYRVERAGKIYELNVELDQHGCVVRGPDGSSTRVSFEPRADGSRRVVTPWGEIEIQSARQPSELWADVGGQRVHARVERVHQSSPRASAAALVGDVRAPMAGKLLRLSARVGDQVEAGQALAVIEAMKMENELTAPMAGVVVEVAVEAPGTIEKGALILRLEAP